MSDLSMAHVIFLAFALFALALLLQFLVWRLASPARSGARLALIFLVLPGIACAVPMQPEWGFVYLLHLSLSGCYLLLYTGVTSFSPSVAIVQRVHRSMPGGLPREQLAPPWFVDAHLVGARRENLLASGLLAESNGILRLTARGRFIATCFLLFRRFLGLPDLAKG